MKTLIKNQIPVVIQKIYVEVLKYNKEILIQDAGNGCYMICTYDPAGCRYPEWYYLNPDDIPRIM